MQMALRAIPDYEPLTQRSNIESLFYCTVLGCLKIIRMTVDMMRAVIFWPINPGLFRLISGSCCNSFFDVVTWNKAAKSNIKGCRQPAGR